MNKNKKQFSVHCILCGKNFYADTPITCGGTYSGKPMCETNDIQQAVEKHVASIKEKQK